MSVLELIEVTTDAPARAVFTTRRGGTSEGRYAGLNLGADTGDRPEAVRANRSLLCAELGLAAERVSMVRQVHGAEVRRIDAPSRPGRFTGGLRGWPEGDGLASRAPGLGLAVLGAAVGPGIGPCCYPVSAEVRDRFAAAFGEGVVRGAAVDLAAAARAALVGAGVPAGAVQVVGACTSCEADRLYSYRRDGAACGRQAGVVWALAREPAR